MNIGLDDVREWGLDVALVLDRLVDGDLEGMFDGPTTDGIDLDSPLIVFDLSTIDRNSIAMPILMAIVGVWLEHTWLRPDRRKRILLVEEAWHIIAEPSVAQLFQRLLKFGRRLGLSFVAVVHHLSDVIDGAAAREAAAILKMASTRTVYMQKSDEARATGKVLGLPRWAVEIIPTLSPGIAVWDVNGDVQVVKHIVTEVEKPLVYTDRAMTESSARPEPESALGQVPAALGALPPELEPLRVMPAAPTAPRVLPPTRSAHALPQRPVVGAGLDADALGPPAQTQALPATASPRLSAVRPPDLTTPLLATPSEPTPSPTPQPFAADPVPAGDAPPVDAVLRPVPPALAAAKPSADDPELTALAAALFGPRAQTPSHPRRPNPGRSE
jgi:TraG P-loop domain